MNQTYYPQTVQRVDSVTMNRVLRNTYLLLSMTLLFSAAMAAVSAVLNLPPQPPWYKIVLTSSLKTSKRPATRAGRLMGRPLGPVRS